MENNNYLGGGARIQSLLRVSGKTLCSLVWLTKPEVSQSPLMYSVRITLDRSQCSGKLILLSPNKWGRDAHRVEMLRDHDRCTHHQDRQEEDEEEHQGVSDKTVQTLCNTVFRHTKHAHRIFPSVISISNRNLLLHINCSIRASERRVFYGAVKLGSFYGSNSMNHYCFFPLDIDEVLQHCQAGSH